MSFTKLVIQSVMKKKSRIPFIKTSFWLSSIVITDFYKRKKTSSVLKSYHYSHTCFFFSFSTHSVLQAVYEIEKLKNVRYWLRLGAFHKLHQHFLEGKGQKLRKKIPGREVLEVAKSADVLYGCPLALWSVRRKKKCDQR